MEKRLGDLNGRWTAMFKAALVVLPCALCYLGWLTNQVSGNTTDIATMKVVDETLTIHKHASPPQWFVDRMDRLEEKVDSLVDRELNRGAGT